MYIHSQCEWMFWVKWTIWRLVRLPYFIKLVFLNSQKCTFEEILMQNIKYLFIKGVLQIVFSKKFHGQNDTFSREVCCKIRLINGVSFFLRKSMKINHQLITENPWKRVRNSLGLYFYERSDVYSNLVKNRSPKMSAWKKFPMVLMVLQYIRI